MHTKHVWGQMYRHKLANLEDKYVPNQLIWAYRNIVGCYRSTWQIQLGPTKDSVLERYKRKYISLRFC